MTVGAIESVLARRTWLPCALVLALYGLLRLPDILVVTNFAALAFPLESLYFTRLLFDGLTVRPEMALTLVNPANAALIYPPALYLFGAVSGKVGGLFWSLFLFQLAVGPLLYALARKVLPRTGALLLALLATYYCTRTNWWAPDFLIQPLMLAAILLLLSPRLRRGALLHLLLLGQIAGLVIAFKQNIGVFFAILCGTWLFLGAFGPASVSRPQRGAMAAGILLIGFFAFIPVFGMRLLYADEWLFYLLPYAAFWTLFAVFLRRERLNFALPRFLRHAALFSASALLLPGLIFAAFGGVIGYGRYWQSLFGMGLNFLPIWDHGIAGVVRQHLNFSGVATAYNSMVIAGLFLLPLAANLFAVWRVGNTMATGQGGARRTLALFRIAALGVMGVFMFFPLEGYHILSSKIFLFIFVAAYFLRGMQRPPLAVPGYALTAMLLPVLALGAYNAYFASRMQTEPGSPALQRRIGMPLQRDIALELSRQLDVIRRSVRGQPYYVIDSSGGTLVGLAALEDNRLPQYYVEMRRGILDEAVVAAIKTDLASRPYVIVNEKDYAGRSAVGGDPRLKEVLAYVAEQYAEVDAYRGPESRPASVSQILDFVVLEKRGAGGSPAKEKPPR